jgi:hypothetical protein
LRHLAVWPTAATVATRLFEFDSDGDEGLLPLGPSAREARFLAADVRLIHFDDPGQPLAVGPLKCRSQPVQHRPGRLVRADLQGPLQALRRDPVFTRGEQPHRGEPYRQRCACRVEDRACRHGGAAATTSAHDPPVPNVPFGGAGAVRAPPPVGPAQPLDVVPTVVVCSEPGLELAARPWVVNAATRVFQNPSILLRLNGYPQHEKYNHRQRPSHHVAKPVTPQRDVAQVNPDRTRRAWHRPGTPPTQQA